MNTLENTSVLYLAKVLKRLLDVAWVLAWLISLAGLGILAVLIGTGSERIISSWAVQLPEAADASAFTEAGQGLRAILLSGAGELQFTDSSAGFYGLMVVQAVLIFGMVLAITYLLRQIFSDLLQRHPFTLANARRIRTIAWLFILILPLKILGIWLWYGYVAAAAKVAGYELVPWIPFVSATPKAGQLIITPEVGLDSLFVGLLLLVIAEVFRQGVLLKSENEAFV